ncbi:DeoR family regulatory proteins [Lactobacillus xylocopicola]|uniref:DeoR family regulatory proteins n=2 Tax=Lactobacillus xylocopicola TaxID=2976676 RepID=A0ABN6SKW5_9LACO|nr:DeoR family regulatory proteins [Lactobacillus xylocopicola]
MYSEERRNYINQLIKDQKQVKVLDLANRLKVSEVTIRKDLSEMEKAGLLKRTFGGAIDLSLSVTDKPYKVKKSEFIEQKDQIAQYAASFVKADMTIFLDAGSTTHCLIKYLKNIAGLKLVTIDLNIALKLLSDGAENVYFVGGKLSTKTNSSDSVNTVTELTKFNFDLSFIGCDTFSLKNFQTGSESKAKIKEVAFKNASLGVILADSSKYKKSRFINFLAVDEVDYVVTDQGFKKFLVGQPQKLADKFLIA